MSIRAWLREGAKDGQTPREARLLVSLEATGISEEGSVVPITVHNISATGMLLECQDSLEIGHEISVDLPRSPETKAVVVWTSGQLCGCRFADRLSSATLSATQLRSVIGSQDGPALKTETAPSEPFDVRLQRLRKQRGLTLAEVAQQLGVSKPTVWAWEQARSSPTPDRYEKIAEVLGTTVSALRSGREEDIAADILERSRRRIAKAYGVGLDSVRIMIEL